MKQLLLTFIIHATHGGDDLLKEAVTFSHVSGEPVSHVPPAEVKHGSELVDMTETVEQFHGSWRKLHLSFTNVFIKYSPSE